MAEAVDSAIGVAVVVFNSGDVICDCLSSLRDSEGASLKVAVIDNASPDDSAELIRAWAAESGVTFEEREVDPNRPGALQAEFTLLRVGSNLGFAGGVNVGLRALGECPQVDLFWVLNPDCIVDPAAAAAYRARADEAGEFGLMSGRTLYCDPPTAIQSDGAKVSRWTGVCSNLNSGASSETTSPPPVEAIDYFVGANVLATRAHIKQAGLMPELYFLFFEEVEWALKRGPLRLIACPDAIVRHHTGTAIGSGAIGRRPSGFANYFNYRNRMWFVWRNYRRYLLFAYAYSALKCVQLLLACDFDGVVGAFLGMHSLPPTTSIRAKLSPEAAKMAFG